MSSELSYLEITTKLWSLDPKLALVFKATSVEIIPSPSVDIYASLLQSIVSQQLSTKVAAIIWKRFLDLFPANYPDYRAVLDLAVSQLRGVGLSGSKSPYIQNVALFASQNDMSLDYLMTKSDTEIVDYLTAIKGVGKWTVQMILMFPMDRQDVFPVDDLGIQTKMKHWYDLTSEKKQLKKEMLEVAASWAPYKTLACKYLWASVIPKT